MNNQDLAKIVKQVQKDKEQNFERLVHEIYRTIYYLSFKFLGSEEEAQDVAQDILLNIYKNIDELKVPESFNRWMNRIIYSRCTNRLKQISNRKEEYNEVVTSKEETILEESPENIVQTKEKNKFILEIINDLPIKQKEVVLLYYYQQLTAPEIASVLDCSLPSIQNRLYYAKKSIRNRMEKSTTYTCEQLFCVGGASILLKIFLKEAKSIVPIKMSGRSWSEVISNKEIGKSHVQENKARKSIGKYNTNKVMLCLIPILTILFSAMLVWATMASKEPLENRLPSKSNKMKLQPEAINQSATEEDTILNKSGNDEKKTETLLLEKFQSSVKESESNIAVWINEETKVQVEGILNHTEIKDWTWNIVDISTDNQKRIWDGTKEKIFTNTAILEDKGLEDLTYDYKAGGNEQDMALYEEAFYKKDSQSVYHVTMEPTISFYKTGFVEDGSDIYEDQNITYYLQLENIGEVAAFNIVVKDIMPKYTEFVKIEEGEIQPDMQVSSYYKKDTETIYWTIDQLRPSEAITLVFQVRIIEENYKQNREIKNIAYMKVAVESSEVDSWLISEQGYIKSNEIIYIMRQKEVNIPRTNDITIHGEIYILFLIASLILMIIIQKKISRANIRK
jgi:RNA polymerase sigma factor, sigma-70 family